MDSETKPTSKRNALNFLLRGDEELPKPQSYQDISLERCVDILELIKTDLDPIFEKIIFYVNQVQRLSALSIEEIKEGILNRSDSFNEDIQVIQDKVLEKYKFDEENFHYAAKVTYKDQSEVKKVMGQIRQLLDNSFRGFTEREVLEIPSSITPTKLFQVTVKYMKESLHTIRDCFNELKEKGVQIHPYAVATAKIVDAVQNLNLDQLRDDVLKDAGFADYGAPAYELYVQATEQYTKGNPEFQAKMAKLHDLHDQHVQTLMTGKDISEDEIDRFGDEL